MTAIRLIGGKLRARLSDMAISLFQFAFFTNQTASGLTSTTCTFFTTAHYCHATLWLRRVCVFRKALRHIVQTHLMFATIASADDSRSHCVIALFETITSDPIKTLPLGLSLVFLPFRRTIAGDENGGRLGFSPPCHGVAKRRRIVIRYRRTLSFSGPRSHCVITSFDTTTSGSAKTLSLGLSLVFLPFSVDDSGRRERWTIGILATRYPFSSPVIVFRSPFLLRHYIF